MVNIIHWVEMYRVHDVVEKGRVHDVMEKGRVHEVVDKGIRFTRWWRRVGFTR